MGRIATALSRLPMMAKEQAGNHQCKDEVRIAAGTRVARPNLPGASSGRLFDGLRHRLRRLAVRVFDSGGEFGEHGPFG